MPILEAMACGLPVIATNWSAQTDFFNETNGYPVEVARLVTVQSEHPYYRGMRWAEPSYEHLRQRMRHVYQHRDEARYKGQYAATEAHLKWTWDHSARKIITRLGEIDASSGRGFRSGAAA
jgi:glycosyltransferase involved in cell wall biosynthesis